MIIETLSEFFERDLLKLKEEIASYSNETAIWKIEGDIRNTAGNLALHLVGNINHFIGAVLGKTGYIREREREFSDSDVPRIKLIQDIDTTIAMAKTTFSRMDDSVLYQNYPIEKHGKTVTVEHMLLHLLAHLNYHLGQVNYHRRLIG
ncbi:MAG TPA: DinB family protein [bacterium]|nr:DinB family protein [bacterium]HMW31932.1 DinB family protein [bacterium]HMW35241.1 DinB family protein [bacterium]HMY34522.1 DinB family protein [bacterium]HMZ03794.1 DinB family protein [bacterium]